jgi:predicted Zn finger-like uncharacterized protein
MYTRCPECQTAFRITVAQLKVRDGLVRCGRCDSIFRADLRLFAPAATEATRGNESEETEMFIDVALEAPGDVDHGQSHAEREIPVVSDLSFFQPQRRWAPALWFFAVALLAVLWVGQFVYFYRDELAQLPDLRPALVNICNVLQCDLAAMVDKTAPELVQTSIAPHPRYANALRLRASLVNRSDRPLPLPLMQVSITDSGGQLLARRVFAPREYLAPGIAATPLAPSVMVQALLDVTNPDNKAAGYEVQLFRQQPARAN